MVRLAADALSHDSNRLRARLGASTARPFPADMLEARETPGRRQSLEGAENGTSMTTLRLSEATTLPSDGIAGAVCARVWRPECRGSFDRSLTRGRGVRHQRARFPTMRDLCEESDPAAAARAAPGERLASFGEILANTPPDSRDPAKPWLLAPIDLQAIKAAGVTFATSLIERVIEERARGQSAAARGDSRRR